MSIFDSQERWANFWLDRVGWEPSWCARKIAEKCSPGDLIADIGGGHGRDSLWLKARGFRVALLEPNPCSLKTAWQKSREMRLYLDIIRSALPEVPVRDGRFNAAGFQWGLHSYRDEDKLTALKEIHRVMAGGGLLFSASFGSWSGYRFPPSIHAVPTREEFIAWHEKAGFRTLNVVELTDETYSFEKSWCGEFEAKRHEA